MADIVEAFNTLKFQKKPFHTIDYFFSQRTLNEDQEFFDKNMNRKIKKVKITHNFLALNIPTIIMNQNGQDEDKPMGFDIEIYGDEGYHYKGTITSYMGVIPNFMIPIKGDKKLFVNINYKFSNSNSNDSHNSKKFVNFIEVPKRFQITESDIKENSDLMIDKKSKEFLSTETENND
jgi:hypothetical protein